MEGRYLVKAASFYEGQIKIKLDSLKRDVDSYIEQLQIVMKVKKLTDRSILPEEEWDLSEKQSEEFKLREEKIKVDLKELKEIVDNAQKWIAALSLDLNRAKEVSRNFKIEQIVTPKKLRQQLSHFDTSEKQLHYLEVFLKPKARKAFIESVFNEAKILIGVIAKKSNLWGIAAEVCERNGLADNAKRYWKNEGDFRLSLHKYKEAAEAYEKAKKWDQAGDSWLQNFDPLHHVNAEDYDESVTKAAEAYNKAGDNGFRKVAEKLMREGRRRKDIYISTVLGHAGLMFYKNGDFKNAGQTWVEAAHSTTFDVTISDYYKKAADAFRRDGDIKMAESCENLARNHATYAWINQQPPSDAQRKKF